MALTWDLTKINDYENVCWNRDDEGNTTLNPATESLIWLSMGIGMNSINEKNADEFYSRVCIYEKMFNGMRSLVNDDNKIERICVTPEEVHAHIGLRTNASVYTPSQFRKNVCDHAMHDASRSFKKYVNSLIVEDSDV